MNQSFLQETGEGVYLALKVQPRASRNSVRDLVGNELKVCVTAPPVDSAANEAVVELIAELLGVSRATVQLVRGNTSRHKRLFVRGLNAESVLQRLKRC